MPKITQRRVTTRDAKIIQHEMNEEIDAAILKDLENAVAGMLFRMWLRKRKKLIENKLKISK